jgi:hypothetical protein
MKKLILLSAFVALPILSTYGQQATNGTVLVAPESIQKPKEEKKVPLNPPKMTNAVLGKPIVYGGYVTDLVRAEKKRSFFDLSAPLDPQKDMENVFFNSNQDLAHPLVLFRIKF